MKVAVLGASGGMGSFFVRYFLERGYTVRGSDPRGRGRRSVGDLQRRLVSVSSNGEAVRGVDLTLMAVPMDDTLKVAEEVIPKMKRGSTLVEISSVKGG
ncbi:MAG TPA: prephenate dehydrogenase/arogenate dehydrogenase family protein, partial [Nitrososphaerales archaeon]|nr:prephenate dehydrogenase/arogenate dehydrogenase family protein [Nitrososphaerales archaeon]